MSDEYDLPSELANFEAQLRQEPLPATGIDRDRLMYQAGWAAAESVQQRNWLWPATSGGLAASLLVLAGLLILGTEKPPRMVSVQTTPLPVESSVATSRPQAPSLSLHQRPPRQWNENLPLLVMRDRALRMEFDEPATASWTNDDSSTEPTTARQLLQELLGETS